MYQNVLTYKNKTCIKVYGERKHDHYYTLIYCTPINFYTTRLNILELDITVTAVGLFQKILFKHNRMYVLNNMTQM